VAIAATIDIVLAAATKKFDAAMKQSSTELSRLGKSVVGINKLASGLIGTAVGFLTVQRAVSGFMDTFRELDELSELADKIGISSNALAALQMHAEDSGSDVETMNRALATLGRTTRDSVTPLDIQFRTVAERVASASTAIDKIKIATDAFGKSGLEIVSVLNKGSKGFDDAMKAAEDFGSALSDIEKNRIDALDKSINRLSHTWQGLKREATAAIAPHVKNDIDLFTDFIKIIRLANHDQITFVEALKQAGRERAAIWQAELKSNLAMAFTAEEIEKGLNRMTGSVEDAAEQFERMKRLAEQVIDQTLTPTERWLKQWRELRELSERGLLTGEQFDRAAEEAFQAFQKAKKRIESLKLAGDFLGIKSAIDRAFDTGGSVMRSVDDFFGRARDRLADFLEAPALQDIGSPAAAERGSIEAFNVMADIQRQQQGVEIQQVALAKKQLEKLGEIATKIGKFASGLLPAPL